MNSNLQTPGVVELATRVMLFGCVAVVGCAEGENRQAARGSDAGGAEDSAIASTEDTMASRDGRTRDHAVDSGTACTGDAGLAPIPDPTSDGMYARRIDRFSLDGELSEDAGSFHAFTDDSGASDNRVEFVSAWSETQLYLGFRVEDGEVDADGSPDPWRNDGFEVAFDFDGPGGTALSGDEVKWIFTADGAIRAGAADSEDWSPASENAANSAVEKTSEGYVLEVAIPVSALKGSLRAGRRLDVEIVNHDRDGDDVVDIRWGGGGNRISTPAEWRWIELAGASCRRNREPDSDAGDTDTTGCMPQPFDTITVGAGETREFRLGDGDVLENKLIDITAPNAKYDIVASGSDWTIRNIGVEGRFQGDAKSSPLRVRVTDENGEGLVEHLYLGDGGGEGRTGLFVLADHAGTLRVRELNVQHWGDNGVYGSAPGNHQQHGNPGEGGIVRIFDSFANDNGSGGFRIGTDGSFCKNCVSINARQFAFWGYYDNTKFINCDAANAASASFAGNARYWIERGVSCGSIEVVDSRHSGSRAFALECEKIGQPKPNPRTSPPTGVPTTPREAASGCATR